MEAHEIQARAVIAAALIATGKYEVDHVDAKQHWTKVQNMVDMRAAIDLVYGAVAG